MKSKLLLVCTILLLCMPLLLSGCSGSGQDGVSETVIEKVTLEEAATVLRELENSVLYVNYSAVQPYDYDKLLELLKNTYGSNYRAVWSVLFDKYPSESGNPPRYVSEGQFFPTIWHEGIEITDAYIEKTVLPAPEESSEAESAAPEGEEAEIAETEPAAPEIRKYLVVVEGYTGEDPLLTDFSRTNRFVRGENGAWVFDSFQGNINVGGEGLNQTYLPLKEKQSAASAESVQPASGSMPELPS